MDLTEMMNQQYEEVDSKMEQEEQKVNMDEVLEPNKLTRKWLEGEAERIKDREEAEAMSKEAFAKKAEEKRSEQKKEEKKSTYYSYREKEEKKTYSYYSSSSTSSKTQEEKFYDKMEDLFNHKLNKSFNEILNRESNRFDKECSWDVLDWQYSYNKKRVKERYVQEKPDTKEFYKQTNKLMGSIEKKVELAELLVILKICPYI